MDIFGQLGINTTAAFQFVFFAIALTFLSRVVFGPYSTALEERQKRTKGGEDLALEYQTKAIQLQHEYESKVRDINTQIKMIIDSAKSAASKEYETLVSSARSESEKLVVDNRSKVASAIKQVSEDLKSQTTVIATVISNKLLK
jgi:F-type H+-transporting ATPase subunit b